MVWKKTDGARINGCVRSKRSAASIARVILRSVYGEDYDESSFTVDFAEGNWFITNRDMPDLEGGAKYLILSGYTAEVIAIWEEKDAKNTDFEITEERKAQTEAVLSEDCICDVEDAVAIARAIFRSVYGRDISLKQMTVTFYEVDQVWEFSITPSMPEILDGIYVSMIRKNSAKVISLWSS